MPRSAVLGNGSILINFLPGPVMKEVYYPLPGMKLTTGRHGHSLYVGCDGGICRAGDAPLQAQSSYVDGTLVLNTSSHCEGLGLAMRVTDAVHPANDVIIRRVVVSNTRGYSRMVRIYMMLDTAFLANDTGDTAMLDPQSGGIVHFKESTFMLVNAASCGNASCLRTTGKRPTLREMPAPPVMADGSLGGNPVSQGAVYSAIAVEIDVPPSSSQEGHFYLSFGSSLKAVRLLDSWARKKGARCLIDETEAYWRRWLVQAPVPETDLPREATSLFLRSLLTCRTLCANNGAVLAATDLDMLDAGHDHYCYVWPRDGALVTRALLRAGIKEPARKFVEFCARALGDEDFLWQRYHPDGSLGSTWHSWSGGQLALPPIQEDETALPLWLLGDYIDSTQDLEFLRSVSAEYFRMAGFLVAFVHRPSSLPFPSRDLWEERYGVFTFTVASVAAGLEAAARLAALLGMGDNRDRYLAVRSAMVTTWQQLLFEPALRRFARGLYAREGDFGLDLTLDASLLGIWSLGLLPADDPRVLSTLRAVETRLRVDSQVGGLARYEGDYYFRRSDDVGQVPGNPWTVCTLWAASTSAEIARKSGRVQDLERSRDLILWAVSRASAAGMLAEQFDPATGEPLSVSPLTWSHAAYIDAYLDYAQAWSALQRRPH